VVLLVVPISLMITRHVISPLNELARTARAIADGAKDTRAHVASRNEIGEVAEALNMMADRVTASNQELMDLNADLEQRVTDRTRELEELASRDPLTGLYNRRHFGEVITREFASAERYDADLTCIMFDVDHFKETNDRFGHRTGDGVLTLLAEAISCELRESDVAARFGGDEFILLLPQTSARSASSLADRIVSRFSHGLKQTFPDVPATLSIGVASLRATHAPSSEALIHEADVALYTAKESGRNRTIAADAESTALTG
jgi:diguanylate cyclase (GGDEF)-like protein